MTNPQSIAEVIWIGRAAMPAPVIGDRAQPG